MILKSKRLAKDKAKKELRLIKSKTKSYNRQIKEELVAIKGGKCEICKQVYPAPCFDFHHNNQLTKDLNISQYVLRMKKPKLNELEVLRLIVEIRKCSLLCSNCHRFFHFGESTLL